MAIHLGIDTSNYTTSAAVYNDETQEFKSERMLLPVKSGELGLRQSDAVYHHTVQLPCVIEKLFENSGFDDIDYISVSDKPRSVDGSYMPCFNAGVSVARSIAAVFDKKISFFSHQCGHISAALFSAGKMAIFKEKFIAFHLSGGTTEAVLVTPDKENVFNCEIIASSLDLKAGQAVDRVGKMLGINFPAGKELEKLAETSNEKFKIKPSIKGADISLSGVENKCMDMLNKGAKKADIALFCIEYIKVSLYAMTQNLTEIYGDIPLVYAGGVMSNKIIKDYFEDNFNAFFASAELSSDNAVGTAILSAYCNGGI